MSNGERRRRRRQQQHQQQQQQQQVWPQWIKCLDYLRKVQYAKIRGTKISYNLHQANNACPTYKHLRFLHTLTTEFFTKHTTTFHLLSSLAN